jgi:hypothetical protein
MRTSTIHANFRDEDMMTPMCCIRHQFQILVTIVVLYPVPMVHHLGRQEIPAQAFLDDEPVFRDIPVVRKRMQWNIPMHVPAANRESERMR